MGGYILFLVHSESCRPRRMGLYRSEAEAYKGLKTYEEKGWELIGIARAGSSKVDEYEKIADEYKSKKMAAIKKAKEEAKQIEEEKLKQEQELLKQEELKKKEKKDRDKLIIDLFKTGDYTYLAIGEKVGLSESGVLRVINEYRRKEAIPKKKNEEWLNNQKEGIRLYELRRKQAEYEEIIPKIERFIEKESSFVNRERREEIARALHTYYTTTHSLNEIAETLGVNTITVKRNIRKIRAM